MWPAVQLRTPTQKQMDANTRLSNSLISASQKILSKPKQSLQDIEEKSNSRSFSRDPSTRRVRPQKLGNFAKPTKSFMKKTQHTSSIIEIPDEIADVEDAADPLETIDVSLGDD